MIIVNDSLTRTYLLQRPGHPETKLGPRHEAELTDDEMLSGAVTVSLVAIEADSQAEAV